ncbi:mevalonate kinase [Lujinxingia vulgaris]|uniref:mevalonate kinase n=1 Tax=Lujinxingia vulgaris TaxID=2600176 RepID=A0A5C6X5I1_9DELT|nr:mevalonate kinase [Lujinxingia vulgaris]
MGEVAEGRGRGKLILFGEHAVVHGYAAVACGLPLGAVACVRHGRSEAFRVDHPAGSFLAEGKVLEAARGIVERFGLTLEALDGHVRLEVPVGAGMGSSAALAVALARAAHKLSGRGDAKTVEEAVSFAEGLFHGRASGIDQSAALGGGVFAFKRDAAGGPPTLEPVRAPTLRLVVAQVAPSASTAEMVAGVSALAERRRATAAVFEAIGQVAAEGRQALEAGDLQAVGEYMNINQGLLAALGVSIPAIDEACHLARGAGALGAKLTGAGGGGCVVALGPDEATTRAIREGWEVRGWPVYTFTLES